MENTFFEHFYRSCDLLKTHYKKFLPIIVFYICLFVVELYYSLATDDITKITSSLGLGLVGVFVSIYLLNMFTSLINEKEFSLRKVFWDIPTYLFYELGFGIMLLIGLFFLVVPGVYIGFFYAHAPVISICFDHLDEEIGVFALTKKAVSQNKILNFGIYLLIISTSFLFLGIETLYSKTGENLYLCLPLGLVLVHILIIQYGILVSFLDTSIKKAYSIESGEI